MFKQWVVNKNRMFMCTCVKCKLEKEKKKTTTKRRLIQIQSETTNHHTVVHTEKKKVDVGWTNTDHYSNAWRSRLYRLNTSNTTSQQVIQTPVKSCFFLFFSFNFSIYIAVNFMLLFFFFFSFCFCLLRFNISFVLQKQKINYSVFVFCIQLQLLWPLRWPIVVAMDFVVVYLLLLWCKQNVFIFVKLFFPFFFFLAKAHIFFAIFIVNDYRSPPKL